MPILYLANETGLKAGIGYGLLLLFLVAYRQLYSVISRKQFSFWLALQIGIVLIFSIGYSPYILLMGFFPANFIGWYENRKHYMLAYISFVSAISLTLIIFTIQGIMGNMLYFLPFFLVMIASPIGMRSLNVRMELEKQLNQANEQIKDLIKREERVRIARDLHDTLGHTLSLITFQSQLVQRLTEKHPERAKAEAKEIEMTSRSALRQVRELVSDMRMITVEEEIANMELLLKAAGIAFHIERKVEMPDLTLLQQNILGMCLREAGTNIVKHSQAKNCYISFASNRGDFTILVKDDGNGIADITNNGNGLIGMRERLSLIEGRLDISANKGTTLIMTMPIVIKQEEEVSL
jgi:two-component system sensor histidine kinase DesK